MKANNRTLVNLSLSLVLSFGLLSSCVLEEGQDAQVDAQGLTKETTQVDVTPSGELSAPKVMSDDSKVAQVEEAVVDDAAARRAKFQAEMKAKVAARIQEQADSSAESLVSNLVGASGNLSSEESERSPRVEIQDELEVNVKKAAIDPKAKKTQQSCQCTVCLEKATKS